MAKNIEDRVKELEKEVAALKAKAALKLNKSLGVGDTFELLGITWKILDITEKGYVCLADRLEDSMKFDDSDNDWRSSALREYLNGKFFEKLSAVVGAENIIPFERNLLSLDGQTEYGTCEDKASIISVDEYRKYRQLIPNAGYWWWMLTPWSTPNNGYKVTVSVVSPSGRINYYDCNYGLGVRPFCILKSNIFVS